MLRVTQAAEELGCGVRHVRHLIALGKLKATLRENPVGRDYYVIPNGEVMRYARIEQTTGRPRGQIGN